MDSDFSRLDDVPTGIANHHQTRCNARPSWLTRMLSRDGTEDVSSINFTTWSFVVLLGLGSWVDINGIWSQLTILVGSLPESWALASYLAVLIQLANTGPIFYTLGRRFFPRHVHERPAIIVILLIGCAACLLLAFFWQRTSAIFGKERSTALLALTFFLALVDCTSSVTFLPFMALLPPVYMSPLFIGQSLCALLPSVVALMQGVKNVNTTVTTCDLMGNCTTSYRVITEGLHFSTRDFFLFLFAMLLLCELAFLGLNYYPRCRRLHVVDYDGHFRKPLQNEVASAEAVSPSTLPGRQKKEIVMLLLVQAWVSAWGNGVIPQIQVFAGMPYGVTTYHLAVNLGLATSAVTCLVLMWFSVTSTRAILGYALLYTLSSLYILTLAVLSPKPFLVGILSGSVQVIVIFCLNNHFISFLRLTISSYMRQFGRHELFLCGCFTQLGSFLGALVTFFLVNYTAIFKQ